MKQTRADAIAIARSLLRSYGIDPATTDPKLFGRAIDEWVRENPNTEISTWWINSSDNQYKVFKREIRRWQKTQ